MKVTVVKKELDDTDIKIVQFLKRGKSYKEISSIVYLSIPAIKYRVLAMRNEFDLQNKMELINHVYNLGLIE